MRCDVSTGKGGVVWQSPVNDWGSKPGGFDFTGAKTLSVWARGEKGGEKVKFGFGGIAKDKAYHDSDASSTDVTLTTEWKQYSIDLKGKDLTTIKSGFYWSVEASGAPITLFMSDIKWE